VLWPIAWPIRGAGHSTSRSSSLTLAGAGGKRQQKK